MCYPNTVAGYHVRGMTGKFMASGALPGIQAKNSTDSKQYKRLCLCGRVASGTGAMKCYPKVCFTKASVTITHSLQVFDWCIMSNPAKGKDLTLQITVNCKRAPGRAFFFGGGELQVVVVIILVALGFICLCRHNPSFPPEKHFLFEILSKHNSTVSLSSVAFTKVSSMQ